MHVSRETYRDMRSLSDVNMQGCINDQTHRIYLPTSLPMITMAYTLFDREVDFEQMVDDYFVSAFGEDGASVREYLEDLSVLFCPKNQRHYDIIEEEDKSLTSGTESERSFINNKDAEEKLARIPDLLEAFLPTIKKNMSSDDACHRLSWVYLNYHSKICEKLSKIFLLGAQNKLDEAKVLIDSLETDLSLMEQSIHNAFDVFLFINCRVRA